MSNNCCSLISKLRPLSSLSILVSFYHLKGGYSLYAQQTTKNSFDLAPGDIFACVADCGWITGHTYVVYGSLLNGCTTFMFESTPVYPNEGRYWQMVERHKITQFYTAPTVSYL